MRFQSVLAADINERALGVFERNLNPQTCIKDDLSTLLDFDLEALPSRAERRLKRQVGRVDMVVAGPPCQGHSTLNNSSRNNDPRNGLYYCLARFAKLFNPRVLLIENVPAVLADRGQVVQRTHRALIALGYEVTAGVVDLVELGVPQTRRRHVLLAVLKNQGGSTVISSLNRMVGRYSMERRSVLWAIHDLEDRIGADPMLTPAQLKEITRQRVEFLFDNDQYDLPDSERPDCHRIKDHSYHAVYGRMRPNEPAPTLTGGWDTVGRGRFVHPTRRRTLTPREAARLQFIPDFFDFSPAVDARRDLVEMIGNAVPPKLSYVLTLETLR
jgi:DNA (cytosine-5)-methyltransferase 1